LAVLEGAGEATAPFQLLMKCYSDVALRGTYCLATRVSSCRNRDQALQCCVMQ
jgi:hypothetical protein